MTSAIDGGTVFKTDTRNRVHLPKARKEALLDAFEKSGLSGARFAKMVGVYSSSFDQWAMRRRKSRNGGEPVICDHRQAEKPVRFLEALSTREPRSQRLNTTAQERTQAMAQERR